MRPSFSQSCKVGISRTASFLIHRLIKIKEWVDKNDPGSVLIPFSGVFENKVIDMDDAERAKYFEESKVTR